MPFRQGFCTLSLNISMGCRTLFQVKSTQPLLLRFYSMFKRKPGNGLTREAVKSLSAAAHASRTIGCPLNTMITVRLCRKRDMPTAQLCKEFLRVRTNYDAYARRHRFPPAYVWTREVHPDGTGEHLHVLGYIPLGKYQSFRKRALSWMPCPTEIFVRKASLKEYLARDGKRHSSLFYIAKQMTPQAVFATNLRRQKGGTILGLRWNCSRNLLPRESKPHKHQEAIATLLKDVLAHIEIPRGSNVESDY